nr:hypothetical protein [uncultured Flavobacterium sp.]
MKTKITLFLVFCILMQISAIGQTKKIAEANFLKTINSLASSSHDDHSDNYSATSTITPFSINKTGVLSATVRYSQIDSDKTIKMMVPILGISGISCDDDYLTLQSKSAIILYEENPKTQLFDTHSKESTFHFGYSSEEDKRLMQLRKELKELQKYYK